MKTTPRTTPIAAGLLICLGLLLLLPATTRAETAAYVQTTENGSIDWLSGEVAARGIGAPPAQPANAAQARAMALRAATVVARRNLLELIKGVQLDSVTTIQNHLVSDDTVVTRVQGQLQQALVTDTAYMSDGSVEVTVQVNLRGQLSQSLLPGQKKPAALQGERPVQPQLRTQPAVLQQRPQRPAIPGEGRSPVTSNVTQVSLTRGGGSGYTGVVVDARGLGVRPALSPRLVGEDGREVYGTAFVGRDYAVQQGMAGYAKDPQAPGAVERVGGNPLLVRAKAVSGEAGTDLILGNAEAERVRMAAANSDILAQCRVMILLD